MTTPFPIIEKPEAEARQAVVNDERTVLANAAKRLTSEYVWITTKAKIRADAIEILIRTPVTEVEKMRDAQALVRAIDMLDRHFTEIAAGAPQASAKRI